MRQTLRGRSYATHCPPGVLGAAARTWADARRVEDQVEGVVIIIHSRRPIGAVATPIVKGSATDAARVKKIIRISS